MSIHFRDIARQAASDGQITADEIAALRQVGWSDGAIRPDEAEAVFAINDALEHPSPEWSDFFVEALGEFIVNTLEPKGYITDEQAEWLIARIDNNGKVHSLTELELIVRLFERAAQVPPRLRDYALSQIEHAVLTGEGPTRSGGTLGRGNVTQAEATLIRRIIFSTGSERPAAVSRSEADMLYRIKDAALGADNAPEWKRLFVQGVGNYLAGFVDHTAISRERAAELNAFIADHRVSLNGFFGKMARSAVRGDFFDSLGSALRGDGSDGPSIVDRAEADRAISESEQTWLEGKIAGSGKVDNYDQALLNFLEEESGFTR